MAQPIWKCIAQLGDMHPLDHGGHWVFVDITRVYDPESEIYDPNTGQCWRYPLECCTYENEVLSDNRYHPDKPAWFANYIDQVASFNGEDTGDLIRCLCSGDPIDMARAYCDIADYFGIDNFDSYPLTLSRTEARKRYRLVKYRVSS